MEDTFTYLNNLPLFSWGWNCHINFLSSSHSSPHFIPWGWNTFALKKWHCSYSSSKTLSNAFLVLPFTLQSALSISTESWNNLGWNDHLRSLSPAFTVKPTTSHVPRWHIYHLTYFQGWWINCFPGQPVPVFDTLFWEEVFPSIQSLWSCLPAATSDCSMSLLKAAWVVTLLPGSPEKPFIWEIAQHYPFGVCSLGVLLCR